MLFLLSLLSHHLLWVDHYRKGTKMIDDREKRFSDKLRIRAILETQLKAMGKIRDRVRENKAPARVGTYSMKDDCSFIIAADTPGNNARFKYDKYVMKNQKENKEIFLQALEHMMINTSFQLKRINKELEKLERERPQSLWG